MVNQTPEVRARAAAPVPTGMPSWAWRDNGHQGLMPVAIMPIHRSITLGYRSLFASILRHFYDLHAERYAIRYAILYIVYAICS